VRRTTGSGLRLLVISLFTMVAAVVFVRPAVAAGMSAEKDCEPSGIKRWYCDVTVTGGVAPYSYSWADLQNAAILKDDGWLVSGQCFNTSVVVKVQVTVTDSTGAQLVSTLIGPCSSKPA
jgi:hypothetical protein